MRPHGTEGATVIARAAASTARSPLAKPGKILSLAWSVGVELRGLEPLTPTLPVWCATSCATAPWSYTCTRRTGRASLTGRLARHESPPRPGRALRRSFLVAHHRLRQAARVVLDQSPATGP